MNRKLVATTTISIHAKKSAVWKALIDPEMVQEYMHGAIVRSDWRVGSPITFTGVWEGTPYTDKGTILEIIPERVLSFTFWSPLFGTEDYEDNYMHVTYHIDEYDGVSTLTITQDNLETDEDVINAEGNWMKVGHHIKHILEEEHKHVL
ncbi:SRPBCC domain-containing protein [Dyadobacter sandarakinus]|uniref:SRPBCC domain-containing protein n=1 Tax=Dyadobacter sandarakinus TaxID=2747268 RepID=A0ABX7I3L6_9BACT|nr:SRPBCC domain-containing protein [Dyadobacter sandarakinus]QRR00419.1 SRPBCC domain-containing protein [Dyadobacter sandarakinus]